MNFLSHYYFDRKKYNPYEVFGMLLPDLIKNADKSWNIHPEKQKHLVLDYPNQSSILKGWNRHIAVDKQFHSSEFFKYHQHQIKLAIKEVIVGSPVKPFFLGHISLELLLDNLLILEGLVSVDKLYEQLAEVEKDEVKLFLQINRISDEAKFLKFFSNFMSSKYMYSYSEEEKITYALKRICMRLWTDPFTAEQEIAITQRLIEYKKELRKDFIIIFDQIDATLN